MDKGILRWCWRVLETVRSLNVRTSILEQLAFAARRALVSETTNKLCDTYGLWLEVM